MEVNIAEIFEIMAHNASESELMDIAETALYTLYRRDWSSVLQRDAERNRLVNVFDAAYPYYYDDQNALEELDFKDFEKVMERYDFEGFNSREELEEHLENEIAEIKHSYEYKQYESAEREYKIAKDSFFHRWSYVIWNRLLGTTVKDRDSKMFFDLELKPCILKTDSRR